ncbi:MAG: DUF4124 domain-containing protein [Rhodanobacteraceae bacterium]|nr:DUF4124 domain-containing protein [Rhodanobacteraceae bacterium]
MTRSLMLMLILAGYLAVTPAQALTIYKCTDKQGLVAYQATPCAAHLHDAQFSLRPEPSTAIAATTATTTFTPRQRTSAAPRRSAKPRRQRHVASTVTADLSSWECRATNGELFYQHSPCPVAVSGSIELKHTATRGRSPAASSAIFVSGKPVARADACRRIHAASASGRPGHERDEDVSTYERNLGRDPCR